MSVFSTPLPNSGRYICATPTLSPGCYLFRVRMHVFDRATNHIEVEFEKNISVDVTRPEVEITDVKTDPTPRRKNLPPPGPDR